MSDVPFGSESGTCVIHRSRCHTRGATIVECERSVEHRGHVGRGVRIPGAEILIEYRCALES